MLLVSTAECHPWINPAASYFAEGEKEAGHIRVVSMLHWTYPLIFPSGRCTFCGIGGTKSDFPVRSLSSSTQNFFPGIYVMSHSEKGRDGLENKI